MTSTRLVCQGQLIKVSFRSIRRDYSPKESITYDIPLGNVTYECPGIQAYVGVQAEKGCINRTAEFTAIAGTEESHRLCVEAAKGMAIAGWRIIADSEVAAMVRDEFEEDKKIW